MGSILRDVAKILFTTEVSCKKILLDFTIKSHCLSISEEITSICSNILLRAVCDKDLQDAALTFWNDTLPNNVKDRFESVMKLHAAPVDDIFLRSLTVILVSLGSTSSSYLQPLFLQPLAPDLTWQEQDITGTYTHAQKQGGVIRATQRVFQFSQSQADQYKSAGRKAEVSSPSRGPSGYVSRGSLGSQRVLSYSEIATARIRQQRKQATQEARGRTVHLVRNYKTGELPDIQISYKDILSPICAIANTSSSFSCFLLLTLLEHVEGVQVRDKVIRVLETTSCHSLAKFSIELSLKRSYRADNIAALAIKHRQFNLGILWAEDALSNAPKKSRDWFQLCDLYRAVQDHSTLLGIRKHELGSDHELIDALSDLSLGNFSSALSKLEGMESGPKEDMIECMMNLSKWENMDEILSSNPLSSLMVHARLSKLVHGASSLDQLMSDTPCEQLTCESHGLQALILHLRGDEDRAVSSIYTGIQQFVSQWRVSEQSLQKSSLLHSCQALAELQDVVQNGSALVPQWNQSYPESVSTPPYVWHNLIKQRALLSARPAPEDSCSFSGMREEVEPDRLGLVFAAVRSAVKRNMGCVASRLLEQVDVTELTGQDRSMYCTVGTDVAIRNVGQDLSGPMGGQF